MKLGSKTVRPPFVMESIYLSISSLTAVAAVANAADVGPSPLFLSLSLTQNFFKL